MACFNDLFLSFIVGCFIITGTYILTKNLFDFHIKKLVNYICGREKLPVLIKLMIFIFGYRKKIEDVKFWDVEYYPTGSKISFHQQMHIIEPFIGFVLIAFGTVLSLFL